MASKDMQKAYSLYKQEQSNSDRKISQRDRAWLQQFIKANKQNFRDYIKTQDSVRNSQTESKNSLESQINNKSNITTPSKKSSGELNVPKSQRKSKAESRKEARTNKQKEYWYDGKKYSTRGEQEGQWDEKTGFWMDPQTYDAMKKQIELETIAKIQAANQVPAYTPSVEVPEISMQGPDLSQTQVMLPRYSFTPIDSSLQGVQKQSMFNFQ